MEERSEMYIVVRGEVRNKKGRKELDAREVNPMLKEHRQLLNDFKIEETKSDGGMFKVWASDVDEFNYEMLDEKTLLFSHKLKLEIFDTLPHGFNNYLFFDETGSKVRYQYSRHGSQEESMDYLEFIARVTSHIPDKGQVMVRYYGLYSNAHRGKIRKADSALSPPPIIEEESLFVPSKAWAEMIRKVYEVDPLLCPSCGGQMRIISFIEEPKTIDRIIRHLELTFEAERPPPPHNVRHELLMAAEEREEYF